MTQKETEPSVAATKRDLDKASAALEEPGAGAIGNLECRVSDLRVRLISTPATTLADIEARLDVIRDTGRVPGSGRLSPQRGGRHAGGCAEHANTRRRPAAASFMRTEAFAGVLYQKLYGRRSDNIWGCDLLVKVV